jgi:hypothetical protein
LHLIVFPSFLATMLELPELVGALCQQLSKQDLTQCARVSRKWHSIVIPHLWRDLSHIPSWDAFRRMLLEDYLAKNQHHELQRERDDMGQAQPSALSKYGRWIRLLPNVTDILRKTRPPIVAFTEQGNQPTAHELLLHLFSRCSPDVQIVSFRCNIKSSGSEMMEPVLAFTFPRVRDLSFEQFKLHGKSELLWLINLLDRCSATLRRLELNVSGIAYDEDDNEEESMEIEQGNCISIKELAVRYSYDYSDTKSLWSRLWRRCGHVEKLMVYRIKSNAYNLAQDMSTYMPHLREILLGEYLPSEYVDVHEGPSDNSIAALLSGSLDGWKVVRVYPSAMFDREAMGALLKHSSTLEELIVADGDYNTCISSDDIVQVLRSCVNLHTLVFIDTHYECSLPHSLVDGRVFTDLDPDTGSFKPWECENSLRVLKIQIGGIPRQDEKGYAYPDERHKIQGRVYDRLARLTTLEVLRIAGNYPAPQDDCLEMSLESGLGRLSGLKKLRELYVMNIETKIGVKEVQWMTENWPRLRVLHGLDMNKGDEEALGWLQENGVDVGTP